MIIKEELIFWTIVLAVILVALIVLWLIGKKSLVKSVLLQLVIEAENRWGAGTGDIKHDVVVGYIKAKFPTFCLFISDKTIDDWIKNAVNYVKKELTDERVQQTDLTIT